MLSGFMVIFSVPQGVFAKTIVVPHILEKSSVGIKEEGVKKARDIATGQSSGKKKQKSFLPNNFRKGADKKASTGTKTVKAPRDVATGQASGKRQHGKLFKTNLNSSRSNKTSKTNLNSSKSNKATVNTSRSNIKQQ